MNYINNLLGKSQEKVQANNANIAQQQSLQQSQEQNNAQQQQVQQQQVQQQQVQQQQVQQQQVQQPISLNNAQQQQVQQPIQTATQFFKQLLSSSPNPYSNTSNPQVQPNIYNDDEKPIESVKKEIIQQGKIEMQIKAQRTMIKLGQKCFLPAMVQIKTSGGNRTNVDLICVLDVSGSMGGDKINLLKETMKFLLETLTPADRLCIITFNNNAKRICPLKAVSKQNIPQFNAYINSLSAGGGTRIIKGMQTALKVMKDRVYKNDVTSVFLLSDGQDDKNTHKVLEKTMDQPQYKGIDTFSIQSFGFGNDHDEDLMTNIAKVMDGNFFFIKELDTLDEAFCSALGGIISVVAKQLILNLQNIAKGLMKDVKISKTYGNMWKKINNKQYSIKLLQLMSGVEKNYVIELQIPNIEGKVQDFQRDHDIIACQFKAKNTKDENVTGQYILKLTLLNSNEQIPQINENNDVLEHYLRLRAAEQIEDAIKQSQNNQNETAQKNLDMVIQSIEQNKKVRRQKMEPLLQDLRRARNNCEKVTFQSYGRKEMRNCEMNHREQKANINTLSYQNCVQTEMLSDLRAKKRG